jgi:hypothetical protein
MTALDLVGGSYRARSPNFDAQRTINLYPEASGSGMSKAIAMLIGTPGCRLWTTVPDYPLRGTLRVSASTAIVVAGGSVFTVDVNGGYTLKGTIARAYTPVSMATNGKQVMLVTGPQGYAIDITPDAVTSIVPYTITQIVDPSFTGADKVSFIDGYFVFNKPGTQEFQITGLYAETIDPLDFASAEGSPDLLISLIADHRELWLFGENSTEVFYNSGNPDFPFERIQGAFIEQGCAAKNSVAKMDNTVVWLTADDRGQGTVQKAVGYTPQRISNHALEFAIASYPTISDAVAYTYQQEGHIFYVLTFPSANATWAYDASTQLWHQRAWRNPNSGNLERHRSICQMAFAGENIVGDWENGNLYVLDLDYYTDNGNILPAIRQLPHSATGNSWQFFSKLWVDLQTGIGGASIPVVGAYTGWTFSSTTVPTFDDDSGTYLMSDGAVTTINSVVSDPKLMLEWSDDGGHSFGNRMTVSAGKIGERKARANFRRLGKSRDRVWRMTITDPVKRAFIAADVEFTVGS